MTAATRLPLLVVTGFLGSGKTTLLRRLLADTAAWETAVLVNEWGEVGLDHHLVQCLDAPTVLLRRGCVCCTLRDDLTQALRDLLERRQRGELPTLRRVVLETTGLADPAPILFTVRTDPVLRHHYRLAQVLTTIDAVNGDGHLTHQPEALKQVTSADTLVLTKTDLAPPETVAALRARLQTLNPTARLHCAVFGSLPPAALGALDAEARLAQRLAPPPLAPAESAGAHASDMQALTLTFAQPLDWIAFSIWLSMLLHAHGESVLRVKGLLNVGAPGPVLLNGVQHILHDLEHLAQWPDADRRSHLVMIVRGLPTAALVRSLQALQAPSS